MLYNPNWVRPITPTLKDLIYVLRHKETWPKGFVWDYKRCSTCAMGLAYEMWPERVAFYTTTSMMEAFDMPTDAVYDIFIESFRGVIPSLFGFTTTPEYIAKKLERYLARKSDLRTHHT